MYREANKSMSEVDLAEKVISYLEELKWDVYQEVQIQSYSAIADIVAVQNGLVSVIEVKKSLGIQVIAQALHWRPYANYVYVATPYTKVNYKSGKLLKDVLKWKGIGSLKIGGSYDVNVREEIKADLNRKALSDNIKNVLREEHKTFAKAGNSDGKRFTPFQKTCMEIVRTVKMNPGICLKDLINSINTHYSTPQAAKACISKYVKKDIIEGIKCIKEGGNLRFYISTKYTGMK